MDMNPNHTHPQPSPDTGTTSLHASADLRAGALVAAVERPLVAVLDSGALVAACEWCFLEGAGGGGPDGGEEGAEGGVRLRKCKGCAVVRFCGVVSWGFGSACFERGFASLFLFVGWVRF
jgi:hypothetical protein